MGSPWIINSEEDEPSDKKITSETVIKEPSILEVVENRIYFYAQVGRSEILKLNKTISNEGTILRTQAQNQSRDPANIYLHINSRGGSVFDGFSALDGVLNAPVPVHTIVDGRCASAATLFSIAGKKRYISRHSFMLIHQLSGGMWGTYSEFKDNQTNLDKLMGTIKDIYREFTRIPPKEMNKILDHDIWFDAETCVKYGLVDEIL